MKFIVWRDGDRTVGDYGDSATVEMDVPRVDPYDVVDNKRLPILGLIVEFLVGGQPLHTYAVTTIDKRDTCTLHRLKKDGSLSPAKSATHEENVEVLKMSIRRGMHRIVNPDPLFIKRTKSWLQDSFQHIWEHDPVHVATEDEMRAEKEGEEQDRDWNQYMAARKEKLE